MVNVPQSVDDPSSCRHDENSPHLVGDAVDDDVVSSSALVVGEPSCGADGQNERITRVVEHTRSDVAGNNQKGSKP